MPVVGNRNMATGAVKPSSFREKSFKEAWCSDVGVKLFSFNNTRVILPYNIFYL